MFEGFMIEYGAAFILSFVFSLYWTPVMRKAALQLGIVDQPDGKLKTHGETVPYFGGLAVYLGFLLTVGVFTDFGTETLGLLLSGSIALMVGLIDDFGVLTPPQKLLGQTMAAIAALSIAVANFNAGRGSVAFLCIVLCGSLLGFLRHNFYPATIYLGDA